MPERCTFWLSGFQIPSAGGGVGKAKNRGALPKGVKNLQFRWYFGFFCPKIYNFWPVEISTGEEFIIFGQLRFQQPGNS